MDWVRNILNSRLYGFMNKRENVRQMTFDINCCLQPVVDRQSFGGSFISAAELSWGKCGGDGPYLPRIETSSQSEAFNEIKRIERRRKNVV